MANTTFNGPVQSQHGFITITRNPTTGTDFPNFLGTKPDFTGLTAASVSAAASVQFTRNTVNAVNHTGGAATGIVLPDVSTENLVNSWAVYTQAVDTLTGVNDLTFSTTGTDVFRTGSVLESRAVGLLTYVTSAANNNTITFTGAGAATNHITIGCNVYFTCTEKGIWNVNADFAKDPLAVTGVVAWSTV